MNPTEEIRSLRRRTELLAPAGKPEVLQAVVEAGADAVYLSGKQFQMRAHRRDFHFEESELRDAAAYVHGHGRRLYVTMNTLLGDDELESARRFMELLAAIGADAVIVCDLATIGLAAELGLACELHASTMLNVHDADQALALKDLGVRRIITSRDISIQEAGRLGERTGLAIEYFLHGDMCVAQSGQCTLSGLAFGKSSNRGECMKPCRWQYELVNLREGGAGQPLREGHLMALRDLSLLRQLPDLIEAGIASLKIEGRMRDAAYVAHLVRLYRETLDAYYDMPSAFCVTADGLEGLFRERVRDFSGLAATGAPSHSGFFDISGKREPLMLSNGAREPSMADEGWSDPEFPETSIAAAQSSAELAVCVSSIMAVRAALDAGADRVYLAAETRQFGDRHWTRAAFLEAAGMVNEAGAALGICTPRISSNRVLAEWATLADVCRACDVRYVLTHHPGSLRRARRDLPEAAAIADYGFNLLNTRAAAITVRLGACGVVPALEAGFQEVSRIAAAHVAPLEIIAHGPVTGMLIDHCLIALNLNASGSKDVCRGPCKHAEFGLRDARGEVRPIITDQYCRNHVLAAKDLAILPCIDAFLALGPASIRIEAQFYEPDYVRALVAAYRAALDRWRAHPGAGAPERAAWCALMAAGPRSWNYGGYAREITRSESTAQIMKANRQ